MTPGALRELMASADEWALFDVREAGEAEAGHIPGASFLPRRQIELRIGELIPDRATRIVVYDAGGGRAALAALTLRGFGYENTEVLTGGLAAWVEDGGDVAEGANVPSKRFGEHIFTDRQVPQVSADELAELVAADEAIICDIRLRSEHETARVPDAWYIGNFDIALAAKQLAETGKTIVCHCAGRTRSILGTQTLRELGVEKAYALKDGTMGWVLSGRELEKGPLRRELEPEPQSAEAALTAVEALMADAGVEWCDADTMSRHLENRANGSANAYVFDVRQLETYEAGHIPGALALPGGQAVLRADDFISVRNAPIILTDEGGARAGLTAVWLRRLGYPRVYACRDAVGAWRAAGRDFATGRGRAVPLGLDAAKAAAPGLDAKAARAFLDENAGALVIDVDSGKSFVAGHLPGAAWVQRGWLEARIADLAPDSSQPILVSCGKGLQSVYAAAALQGLGFENAHYLDGGVSAWKKAGFDVETGAADGSDSEISDQVLPPYARGKEGMLRYLSWEKELTTGAKPPRLFARDRNREPEGGNQRHRGAHKSDNTGGK